MTVEGWNRAQGGESQSAPTDEEFAAAKKADALGQLAISEGRTVKSQKPLEIGGGQA